MLRRFRMKTVSFCGCCVLCHCFRNYVLLFFTDFVSRSVSNSIEVPFWASIELDTDLDTKPFFGFFSLFFARKPETYRPIQPSGLLSAKAETRKRPDSNRPNRLTLSEGSQKLKMPGGLFQLQYIAIYILLHAL